MDFFSLMGSREHFKDTPAKEASDGAHRKEHDDESSGSHGDLGMGLVVALRQALFGTAIGFAA